MVSYRWTKWIINHRNYPQFIYFHLHKVLPAAPRAWSPWFHVFFIPRPAEFIKNTSSICLCLNPSLAKFNTKNDDWHVQSAAPATKTATHLRKTSQKYCACHTKRLSTRYKTRLNVTKCHACHAKRSNEMFETYKNDHFCRTYHRHGHMGIARTVADGCERLQRVANGCGRLRTVATVNATSSEQTLNPQTPRVKREPLLRIREKTGHTKFAAHISCANGQNCGLRWNATFFVQPVRVLEIWMDWWRSVQTNEETPDA